MMIYYERKAKNIQNEMGIIAGRVFSFSKSFSLTLVLRHHVHHTQTTLKHTET